MAIELISVALEYQLPPSEKLVLIALANCANVEKGECFPGLRYLQKLTCLSERSLRRSFDALEKRGLLKRDFRSGSSSVYSLPALLAVHRQRVAAVPAVSYPQAKAGPRQSGTPTPVTVAPPPVTVAPPPVTVAPPPVTVAPINVSYPSLKRHSNSEAAAPPKSEALKSALVRKTEPEGRLSEDRVAEARRKAAALLEAMQGATKPIPKG